MRGKVTDMAGMHLAPCSLPALLQPLSASICLVPTPHSACQLLSCLLAPSHPPSHKLIPISSPTFSPSYFYSPFSLCTDPHPPFTPPLLWNSCDVPHRDFVLYCSVEETGCAGEVDITVKLRIPSNPNECMILCGSFLSHPLF